MLAAKRPGSIVCTWSPTASVAIDTGSLGAYSATKAGVSALFRCIAVDRARFGIRVKTIVPGATETPLMWSSLAPEDIAVIRSQVQVEVSLDRLAGAVEPARGVACLLSEESSCVTRSDLVCDEAFLQRRRSAYNHPILELR